jgi:putative GTP pyrophosphokinase
MDNINNTNTTDNTNNTLPQAFSKEEIPLDIDNIFNQAKQYEELMMMYNCAIREVLTKLEVLKDDLAVRSNRNPIETIKSRIKRPQSILQKLQRKNLDISIENIFNNLNDVAGIRVICGFIDDIYAISDMIAAQDDITILQVKDYIKYPKVNGYRSYHMIVEVPVFFADRKQLMRVEVQLRTIAMDFWASLEHQLKYKKDIERSDEIASELKSCSDVIAETDRKMMLIRNEINGNDENIHIRSM